MNASSKLSKHSETAPERVEQRPVSTPRVDVYENANELLVLADIPGANQNDISIQLEKGQLTIEARRKDDIDANPLVAEYRPADYVRVFSVPQGIDANKIDAQVAAGVLRLRLPKSDALKPRRIEVRAG